MSIVFRALPTGEPDLAACTIREVIADTPASFPCRRCLTDAEVGDRLLLLPYNPFEGSSPYTGHGPVYVHADGCRLHVPDVRVPAQLRSRLVAVRAYDDEAMMLGCEVVEGTELEAVLEPLLADPRASFAHIHYARAGCFACRAETAA